MDTEKLMKNISDLANYEKIVLLDKQLDDFLRVFAELSISDQEHYIHSRQFFKNIYDLGYDDGCKTGRICYANKYEI